MYAQEIAKQIFTEVLPYLGIYPDEELVDESDESSSEDATDEQTVSEGISDEGIPAPSETEADEETLNGGNGIYSEGIDNSAYEVIAE